MAIPPCYADLGKSACDLFSKGYNFGDVKLDLAAAASGNTSFKASATNHADSASDGARRVSANLEVKREVLRSGNLDVSVTSKLTSDKTINTTCTANNVGVDNLKVTVDTNFVPHSGKHTAKVKAAYKRPFLHVNDELLVKAGGGAVLSGAAVLKRCGFYLGYQGAFNQAQGNLQESNFALGYAAGDFNLHSVCMNHGAKVRGSLFHTVNPKLEYGVGLEWAAGSDGAHFGIASKYACCPGVTVRSKFNSDGELGLSYKHELNSNVNVTLSALVDTKALTIPSHRLGLALDFTA